MSKKSKLTELQRNSIDLAMRFAREIIESLEFMKKKEDSDISAEVDIAHALSHLNCFDPQEFMFSNITSAGEKENKDHVLVYENGDYETSEFYTFCGSISECEKQMQILKCRGAKVMAIKTYDDFRENLKENKR